MRVDHLVPMPGSNKAKRRVGRGIGGKGGKTAGAGTKGQQSRGRGKVARGFEGGQMPLKQRVPKLKGFNNPFRVEYSPVNLDQLAACGETTVDPDVLVAKGLVRKGDFATATALRIVLIPLYEKHGGASSSQAINNLGLLADHRTVAGREEHGTQPRG